MSNFKSSNLVSLNDSIVLSFDFTNDVEKYSVCFFDPNLNKKINELEISKNNIISINSNGENWKEQNGNIIISNIQDTFLGNRCLIVQQFDPQYTIKLTESGLQFYYKHNKTSTNFDNIDLNYRCFSTDSYFCSEEQKDQNYYINNQYYYKSNLEVKPAVYSTDEEEYINLSQNNSDLFFLAVDYEVIIPSGQKSKIYSIISKQSGKIVKIDYNKGVTNKKRARFVISDYGRTISHSLKEDSKQYFENISVNHFDSEKYTTPVSIGFSCNNPYKISNITANF